MFQLSTEGLETWAVEAVFTVVCMAIDDLECDQSAADDADGEVIEHVAEFNVTTDGGSVVDIAQHIQDNPRLYFDALNTDIEYHEVSAVTVTNLNLSTEPTFLLIQGKNVQ